MTIRAWASPLLLLSLSACDPNRYTSPLCETENLQSVARLEGTFIRRADSADAWDDIVKIRERSVGTYRARLIRTRPVNPEFPFSLDNEPQRFEFHTCAVEDRVIIEVQAEHRTYSTRLLDVGADTLTLTFLEFDLDVMHALGIPYTYVDDVTKVVDNSQMSARTLFGLMRPLRTEVLYRDSK